MVCMNQQLEFSIKFPTIYVNIKIKSSENKNFVTENVFKQ